MISHYHRPSDLDQALRLVAQPATVPLGGGTSLVAAPGSDSVTVVDLQAVGLTGIELNGTTITAGAMTLLQDLVDSPLVPATVRDLAHREAPNTIRNAATLGGTVASADPESELLAGLLVYETTITIARQDDSTEHSLDDVLADRTRLDGGIITAVSLAVDGRASAHRTARTPADRPIVAVVARRTGAGDTLVAASGVDTRPILINAEAPAEVTPRADFRGSSEYRKRLISVLTQRALDDLEESDE